MCNLYRLRHGPAAILDLVRAMNYAGNLEPLPGFYPDYPAPIVRMGEAGRELVTARWGMPTPPQHLVSKRTGKPIQTFSANVGPVFVVGLFRAGRAPVLQPT